MLFPDLVSEGADGQKTVSIKGFEALVVEAIREIKAQHDVEVAELDARIDALQTQIDAAVARR